MQFMHTVVELSRPLKMHRTEEASEKTPALYHHTDLVAYIESIIWTI